MRRPSRAAFALWSRPCFLAAAPRLSLASRTRPETEDTRWVHKSAGFSQLFSERPTRAVRRARPGKESTLLQFHIVPDSDLANKSADPTERHSGGGTLRSKPFYQCPLLHRRK